MKKMIAALLLLILTLGSVAYSAEAEGYYFASFEWKELIDKWMDNNDLIEMTQWNYLGEYGGDAIGYDYVIAYDGVEATFNFIFRDEDDDSNIDAIFAYADANSMTLNDYKFNMMMDEIVYFMVFTATSRYEHESEVASQIAIRCFDSIEEYRKGNFDSNYIFDSDSGIRVGVDYVPNEIDDYGAVTMILIPH